MYDQLKGWMNDNKHGVLSVFLIMLFAPNSALATGEPTRTISVSGDAEVRVAPDQVIISMATINKNKSLIAAKSANDDTVKSLLSYFVDDLDIDEKYVQTDHLSVDVTYTNCSYRDEKEGKCDPLEIQYHTVEKGVQLRLTDLGKYEAVLAKSFELGINKVSDIQFVTTELRKHKDQARKMAAIAAKEKAVAIADTLGMSVGKPISINLQEVRWGVLGSNTMRQSILQAPKPSAGSADSSLSVGQISVSATVNVNFDMN